MLCAGWLFTCVTLSLSLSLPPLYPLLRDKDRFFLSYLIVLLFLPENVHESWVMSYESSSWWYNKTMKKKALQKDTIHNLWHFFHCVKEKIGSKNALKCVKYSQTPCNISQSFQWYIIPLYINNSLCNYLSQKNRHLNVHETQLKKPFGIHYFLFLQVPDSANWSLQKEEAYTSFFPLFSSTCPPWITCCHSCFTFVWIHYI